MSIIKNANKAFKQKNYKEAYELYKMAKEVYGFDFLDFFIEECKKHLSIDGKEVSENSCECMLRIDNVKDGFVNGWALNKDKKDETVFLEIFVDGKPYSITNTQYLRNDVKKVFGGPGFYGYKSEISYYVTFSDTSILNIKPLNCVLEKNSLKHSSKLIQFMLKGKHFVNPNEKAYAVAENYLLANYPLNKPVKKRTVSVIILNLNGKDILKRCLDSLGKKDNMEIIVIDHGSTDGSLEMLKEEYPYVRLEERGKNYSFSESNNYGAKLAKGDVLLFLNNDILLEDGVIEYFDAILQQGEFGLLGLKLWDYPLGLPNFKKKVNQHLGVHFKCIKRDNVVDAFELRNSSFIDLEKGILKVPAVTAAVMAVEKEDFFKAGGFNEKYFYGQEDVDFCLSFQEKVGKKIGVVLDKGAYHVRGISRKVLSQENKAYIANNKKVIEEEWGFKFRRKFKEGFFENIGYWNHKPLSIAMIVSEVSFETDKADFFTAKELGDAFEENSNVVVGYFDVHSDYDVSGYDIVIVFIDGFNPKRLKNISPHALLIGWARNWFDRWCERPWVELYDIIYASSEYAREFMENKLKKNVKLLRIAASNVFVKNNLEDLPEDKKLKSDYVFTGSYFNSPREITKCLKPEKNPDFKFKLFGHNWEQHETFKKYTNGPVSYLDIPKVYKNTKLVVDDANIATKKWGALNCRIYDALAAGRLCITNNLRGVNEIFDEDFPTYTDEKLNDYIEELLRDDTKREELLKKYRKVILENHTYFHRKESILKDVSDSLKKYSIAIKIAAPDWERAKGWGDYYYARELRYELEKLGYKVRIDCLNDWYNDRSLGDDINIVLRGLNSFNPRKDQINLLWIISHPDLVSEHEIRGYDYTFVASKRYKDKLQKFLEIDNISYLPQASSFNTIELKEDILKEIPQHEILFIGNSRNEYRETVKWCIEAGLPISVYGKGWEQFIPKQYIKGEFVENDLIPYYYKKAKIVLNDHWEDMRKQGFISNRVYDVISVGGTLVTDYVYGIEEIKYEKLFVYKNKKEFYQIINNLLKKESKDVKMDNLSQFSFKERVKRIDDVLKNLIKLKLRGNK